MCLSAQSDSRMCQQVDCMSVLVGVDITGARIFRANVPNSPGHQLLLEALIQPAFWLLTHQGRCPQKDLVVVYNQWHCISVYHSSDCVPLNSFHRNQGPVWYILLSKWGSGRQGCCGVGYNRQSYIRSGFNWLPWQTAMFGDKQEGL